jgi:hypothetical protein
MGATLLALGALYFALRTPPAEETEVSASTLLESAVQEVIDATSLHFRIDRDGQLPSIQGFELQSTEGVFIAPDRTSAELRIKSGPLFFLANLIAVGDTTWLQDPLSQIWSVLPPDQSVAIGPFLSAQGLPTILREDLLGLELIQEFEIQDLPGEILYQLSGQLTTDRLSLMTDGLMASGTWPTFMYVTPSGHLRRIEITDDTGTWLIDVWGFNDSAIVVEPPE